jgi:hypothetical protein
MRLIYTQADGLATRSECFTYASTPRVLGIRLTWHLDRMVTNPRE